MRYALFFQNHIFKVVNFRSKFSRRFNMVGNFITRVNYGSVVAPTHFLTDSNQWQGKKFGYSIDTNLPWFSKFFIFLFAKHIGFFDIVKIGNLRYNIVDFNFFRFA